MHILIIPNVQTAENAGRYVREAVSGPDIKEQIPLKSDFKGNLLFVFSCGMIQKIF